MDNIYLTVDQISDRVSKEALSDRLIKKRCEHYSNNAKLDSKGNEYVGRLDKALSYLSNRNLRLENWCIGVITVPDCPDIILSIYTYHRDYGDFNGSDYKDSQRYLDSGKILHPLDAEGHRRLFLSIIKETLLRPDVYTDGVPQKWTIVNNARDVKYKLNNGIIGYGNSVEWRANFEGAYGYSCPSIIKDHG